MQPLDPIDPHSPTASAADAVHMQEPPAEPSLDPADTLSPSVRRLARQFSLDVTQIQGTGPDGRIRVGDVMALLAGRESQPEAPPSREAPVPSAPTAPLAALPAPPETPTTCVFECDMTAALAHRKARLAELKELELTSYYVAACVAALEAIPEANATAGPLDVGVALPAAHGHTLLPVIRAAERLGVAEIDDALRAALRDLVAGKVSAHAPSFVLYHHGLSGSLLATPTPLEANHAASVGIGKIRRQLVVHDVGGQPAPRVLPLCYLTLSFNTQRLDLHRANRFLARMVGELERWPRASEPKDTPEAQAPA